MFVIFFTWIFVGIIKPSTTEWLSRGLTTATQSSTPLANQPANNALDVELNGASTYATTAAEPYAWWKLDLTEECIVTQIKLVRNTNKHGIDGAEIRVGNNNEAFTANPLFAVIPVYAGRIPTIHDGDVALMGRYVTIQLQQDGASKQLSILDVHVFGYRTNRVPNNAFIGCYIDAATRALSDHSISRSDMTVEICLAYCRSFGDSRYAGLQLHEHCFCGDEYNKHGKTAETDCNKPCLGNPEQYCGGTSRNSIYSLHASGIECYTLPGGQDYRGEVSVTITGKQCQQWTSQSPHIHTRTSGNYPNSGLGAHNFCRNPDGESGAWCYTMDPASRFESCDIGGTKRSCSWGSCSGYHTPDYGSVRVQNSHFHFPWPQIPEGVTRLSFTVKGGTKGVYIAVSPSAEINDANSITKIVLGGSNNIESAYLCDSSADWLQTTNTPNIMNPQEDRSFFIAFSNDTIEIGREGEEPFLIFRPICSLDAKYFAIASGFGDTADWTFCGYDTNSSTGCKGPLSVGWAVRSRTGPGNTSNEIIVVPGKPFLCDGVVTEWHYWGSRSEAFRAIVFRRVFGKYSEYEIVGINDIPAGASGEEEVYLIPTLERIHVLKGDVIGFAFGTSLLVYDENPSDGATVRWYGGAPGELQQGATATFSGSGFRGYSLKAVVDSDKSTSVLAPKGLWALNTEFESKDLAGHKNNGISTNALYPDEAITEGVKGFMSINGAGGSCVEIPTDMDLYLSEFTLLMYIRRRVSNSGRKPIIWFDSYDTSSLLAMDDFRIGFRIVTESNTRQMDSGRYLSYGRWTLMAVTYKAATNLHPGIVSIWLDGHLAGAVSDPSFDRLRTGSVMKVGNCEGKTSYVGDIAWIQVYDKCLDEDDILKGQRIPTKGLAFAESVKVTNSRHDAINFQQVEKGCFHLDNSSAILESMSDVTKMKCAVECLALRNCVAWDWKIKYHTKIYKSSVKTYNVRTCRLLNRTPIENEITKSIDCVMFQLSRLFPVV